MRIKQLFLTLALLCAIVQGAWAQASWDEVYAMTNTTVANWTQLSAGSTTGQTLGTAGTTTYYYADTDLTFTNSNAGGSGLTILGTVYLYVPQGVTVTCWGAVASGQTGGGAGIELTAENMLCILGSGKVNAIGGNAARGGDGSKGGDADWDSSNIWSGFGGYGGNGGGGAGAGIGTRGGTGGTGGVGAVSSTSDWKSYGGHSGKDGQIGATAGAMGSLYVSPSIYFLYAIGGAKGTHGNGGSAGKSYLYDGLDNYCAAGGGGGGCGGCGGAAANIGSGGPGGGGGGGGASGNIDIIDALNTGYCIVRAPGGKGGQNGDGTWAVGGDQSILNYNAINNGQVDSNSSGWGNHDNNVSSQPVGTGGNGNATGSASTSESAITLTSKMPAQSEWDIVCFQTKTTQGQWVELPLRNRMGTTIGAAGTTTYYFVTGDRAFINANAGSGGLTILGTVYLFIPSGCQITCRGGDGSGATGASAGIELTAGNTLYLIGGGKLVATGGNAANGAGGTDGGDASFSRGYWLRSGDGGRGGDGGGGAGAGIGTSGAGGGAGGAGGAGKNVYFESTTGNVGGLGGEGGTAADMGTLYIYQMPAPTTEIHGGSNGASGGNGGAGGRHALDDEGSLSNIWTISGGAGGGAGGFGGAASDIGTGGPGGGGGGGGASGSIVGESMNFFYQVGAFGGNPGANADGTGAASGETTLMTSANKSELAQHYFKEEYKNQGWYHGEDNRASGGAGGDTGSAPQSGSAITVEAELPLQGEGTEETPYLINSTDTWDTFASYVNYGMSFSGKYVKLTENISVTTKVGTVSVDTQVKAFSGTFLGEGHTITATITDNDNQGTAPFCNINGATIRNLTVAGTITSNQRHIAGLVGFANGKNTIEGCAVTATLNVNTDYAGGIVGRGLDSETTISGCVFAGTMNSSSNPNVGAIWGWSDNATPKLENSLEAGTYIGINNMHPMGLQGSSGSITGCYYLTPQTGSPQNACTASGATKAYPMSTAPYYLGNLVQDYGMVKAYANGILYGGTYYMAPVSISLADNADNSTTISKANGYAANVTLQGRTLYKDGAWNTLCLPFSLTVLEGSPLEGATVKTLASTAFEGGTLTMNFTGDITSIEAGKPYIVKWENPIVDLSTLTADYTAQDCDVLTGKLGGNYKISIAAGATVKLQDVTINGTNSLNYSWAGINCLGDATIILKGANTVRGFYDYPGIHVPEGSTLTIKGCGSLDASSSGRGAGIGGGKEVNCGNIVIEGGTITATGGAQAAGIGGGSHASCGNITITNGVTKVTATMGWLGSSIGAGNYGSCGTVTIDADSDATTYNSYTGTGSGSVDVVFSIENPVFNDVTVSNVSANVETDYADFVGTYSPVSIYTARKTNLYLGADNTLYYPTASGFTVNAFRGYFQLKGLTAGEPNSNQPGVRAFVLNFGDDSNATGILTTNFTNPTNSDNEWYSLDGCRLNGKPTAKGIYINNGRKVVIK